MADQKQPAKNKQCPFNGDSCIQEKCGLWVTVNIPQRTRLGGIALLTMVGCAFVVQIGVLAPPMGNVIPVDTKKT
jgi:hypothetical protein